MNDRRRSRGGLSYQPALDGVRAVAVAVVLLFHAGFGWMHGGYFGVSVFFTLSGFLITSLLLTELSSTGGVAFGTFYSRRLRRLLPSSLLCVVAIMVLRAAGEFGLVAGFGGQLRGALLQVYNWVRLDGGSSYGNLFAGAPALVSPLEHYWSLAIEEQFYVLWPITVVVLTKWSRRRGRGPLRAILAVTAACAVAGPLIGSIAGPDAAYWATPARLGELLVGASAAAWIAQGGRVPARAGLVAPALLAAVVAIAALLPAGSGPAFSGWMTPVALASAALILSLQVPGPARRALSLPPVVWVGKISYGLYLYHWPVFVVLRRHGWRTTSPGGAALALAITFAVAVASYLVVEQPIRRATWPARRTLSLAAVAVAATVAAVNVVPAARGFLEANARVLEAASIDSGPPTETLVRRGAPAPVAPGAVVATSTTLSPLMLELPVVPNRPVRILVVGDSTAFYAGQGLATWAVDHPQFAQVDVLWCTGCGFILGGRVTSLDSGGGDYVRRSATMIDDQLPAKVRDLHPDVVVLMTTLADISNRVWNDAEGELGPADARYRQRLTDAYRQLTDTLVGMDVPQVVWVVPPVPKAFWQVPELADLSRYGIQHNVIRNVVADGSVADGSVAGAGERVVACDLDEWLTRSGHDDDQQWRADGVHLTESSAAALAEIFLGPWLLRAVLSG